MKQEYIDQMYGSSVTPVQTEEVQPENVEQSPVEAADNYGYEPDPEPKQGNPYSLEQDSVENTLYGAESKVTLSDDTDLSIIYQSEEEQAALRENLGYMANEVGATQDDVHNLVTHANQQLIIGATADPTESMSTLYEQHGADLVNRLGDAQQLVHSFPELVTWLETTKLGNDAKVINHFIRIAQSPRAQARLQKLRGN
ncbi:TPA: hypothetical protein ACQJT5_004683 [Vibrio parahaemolyticus]